MRGAFLTAIVVAAVVACEEVTDPSPRDAGGASKELPEAGAVCSTEQPRLPGTTDAAVGDGGN